MTATSCHSSILPVSNSLSVIRIFTEYSDAILAQAIAILLLISSNSLLAGPHLFHPERRFLAHAAGGDKLGCAYYEIPPVLFYS